MLGLSMAVALAGLVIAAGIVLTRRQRTRRVAAEDSADVASPKRPDTALGELRDMREALGAATHRRLERRPPAPPQAGDE